MKPLPSADSGPAEGQPGSLTTRPQPRQGFTLIELTVVLAVVVTLVLILTPSVANFINDSRAARARTDCQTIAAAVVQFYRDTGFFPQWTAPPNGGAPSQRLQVLVSGGDFPREETPTLWSTGRTGPLADQLLSNRPGYVLRSPSSELGWGGPYVSSELGSDPWGRHYVVNVGLLDASSGPQTMAGGLKSAVWVLSAGPNGTIDTPYDQSVLAAELAGDDIGFRIQ